MDKQATWARFFVLRVLFGPKRCAMQRWFPDILAAHPQANQRAPAGCVPANAAWLIENPNNPWYPESPEWEEPEYNPQTPLKRKAKAELAIQTKDIVADPYENGNHTVDSNHSRRHPVHSGFWEGFTVNPSLNLAPITPKQDTRLKDEIKELKLQIKDQQQQLLKASDDIKGLEKNNKALSAELSTVKQEFQSFKTQSNEQEAHMQMMAQRIQGIEQYLQQLQN
ncbi:hypothetical protein ACHAQJ_010468 [Trichoderma viride]